MHSGWKLAASHAGRWAPQSAPTAFYDSFGGDFADSPRALFESAQQDPSAYGGFGERFRHVWSLREGAVEPKGSRGVRAESASCAVAISRADVIFANSGLPRYVAPKATSTFVQTWHGTPLKKIGFDITDPRFAGGSKYFQRLRRDVERWDVLVSPNSYSTEVFRSAFRFEGRIIETGYPRNDMLVGPKSELHRIAARAALGIPPSGTAIMYAPTWRDTDIADGRQAHTLALEPRRLFEALGTDVTLLLRLHPLVAETAVPEGPQVLNVSRHPDMRELLMAADVLVTDYSSCMFDFAVTGRPVVFYTYDLDRYTDEARGFYFDLLAEAPGPVVRNEEALIDVLRDPATLRTGWRERYAAFRQRFCHLDDGHAGERVLAAVLQQAT